MTKGNLRDGASEARILILGGTAEARMLAAALTARGQVVTTTLAGRTRAPLRHEGALRIGGFGGAEGLARYLAAEGFTRLVDATHPFAARMSANAAEAARATGIPLLRLSRPPWTAPAGAHWIAAADMAAAARVLPAGARVLLSVGRQEAHAFFPRTDCFFVARAIEPFDTAPADWVTVAARGPFTLGDETDLMRTHRVTHLVSKNAGGAWAAKLDAARALGIPVVMIARPLLPEVETVDSVAAALAALAGEPAHQ